MYMKEVGVYLNFSESNQEANKSGHLGMSLLIKSSDRPSSFRPFSKCASILLLL